jgi:hypothetical protein
MGVCWIAQAYATEIDQAIYYVASRGIQNGKICEDYTAKDTTPGYIVVQLKFDDDGRLFLHFVRYGFFRDDARKKAFNVLLVDVSEGERLVKGYMTVDISSEKLVDLIRNDSGRGLFTKSFGPFYRIANDRSERIDTGEPWTE